MGWADHWTNGGTGITKTSDTTDEITESVRQFGDPQIYMKGTELHCSRENCDISDFWKFHKERLNQDDFTFLEETVNLVLTAEEDILCYD